MFDSHAFFVCFRHNGVFALRALRTFGSFAFRTAIRTTELIRDRLQLVCHVQHIAPRKERCCSWINCFASPRTSVRQNNCLLDFSNLKIFFKFYAYEHGPNCVLHFRAEICKTFFSIDSQRRDL